MNLQTDVKPGFSVGQEWGAGQRESMIPSLGIICLQVEEKQSLEPL